MQPAFSTLIPVLIEMQIKAPDEISEVGCFGLAVWNLFFNL